MAVTLFWQRVAPFLCNLPHIALYALYAFARKKKTASACKVTDP